MRHGRWAAFFAITAGIGCGAALTSGDVWWAIASAAFGVIGLVTVFVGWRAELRSMRRSDELFAVLRGARNRAGNGARKP